MEQGKGACLHTRQRLTCSLGKGSLEAVSIVRLSVEVHTDRDTSLSCVRTGGEAEGGVIHASQA